MPVPTKSSRSDGPSRSEPFLHGLEAAIFKSIGKLALTRPQENRSVVAFPLGRLDVLATQHDGLGQIYNRIGEGFAQLELVSF
ncbi:MAG: hypothetical protein AMS18_16850 [Gemmatimonas sp. SG8_17]|nr:MAG: hypothetical protein AMS18_16850 [Gemmatimonas sp. SG8_17]